MIVRPAKSVSQLVAEANAQVESLSVDEAAALLDDAGVLFVDLRDVRELQRTGTIPGAFHAPRGMLEFWVDPDSPYFKEALGQRERLVLFCQSSWRSALAAKSLADMGRPGVSHITGGFKAWQESGAAVEEVARRD